MKKVKIGMVGLGQRGASLLNTLLAIEDVEIVAVCDLYEDRRVNAAKTAREKRGQDPKIYADFSELLQDENVQATFIVSSWEAHVKQAIESMRAGKITAMEVGGAYNVEECEELVAAYEETHTPVMMMENCCYDRFELLSTALVRKGLLGEVVHCHGAYSHDLRDEILGGNVNRHYRLKNYKTRNCENYPTHDLGPIAKILNLNCGNRMLTLTSQASKSAGLQA
ncbi:MAG: Gfo/Idh/MocA family oxidoreductase, partial [Clostridia bacterium]|nr:Gfo/Idh/MocA family oxidoreductase [Clostridia bacterium]